MLKHARIAYALLRLYFRLIPQGWWRNAPYLPLPPSNYLMFRLHTAYGGLNHISFVNRDGYWSIGGKNVWVPWSDIRRDIWQYGDWLRSF